MKTIPCKFHRWVFSMNFQLCLHGIITVYETLMFHMYVGMHMHEFYMEKSMKIMHFSWTKNLVVNIPMKINYMKILLP